MKDAGVACVIDEVETNPVANPFSEASSKMVFTGAPFLSTPIAPLFVFTPAESAVPPAALSVKKYSLIGVLKNQLA